jgi:hypothetical protein
MTLPNFKTTKAKPGRAELYHISFKDRSFGGMWSPDNPAGFDESEESSPGVVGDPSWPYGEPSLPRISVGPTIEQCFRGVFPNVAQFFEKKNYPYMQFSVFSPKFVGTERIITPEELTKHRMVWDACVNDEHCILDEVYMGYVGTVIVYNTNKSPTMYIHPFGDEKLKLESVGPATIKWKWETKLVP